MRSKFQNNGELNMIISFQNTTAEPLKIKVLVSKGFSHLNSSIKRRDPTDQR